MRLLLMIRFAAGGFRLRKARVDQFDCRAAALACSAAIPAAQAAGTAHTGSVAARPSATFYFRSQRVNQGSKPTTRISR
jgi:hypothetical protein